MLIRFIIFNIILLLMTAVSIYFLGIDKEERALVILF